MSQTLCRGERIELVLRRFDSLQFIWEGLLLPFRIVEEIATVFCFYKVFVSSIDLDSVSIQGTLRLVECFSLDSASHRLFLPFFHSLNQEKNEKVMTCS
jgi:hypothetical protein